MGPGRTNVIKGKIGWMNLLDEKTFCKVGIVPLTSLSKDSILLLDLGCLSQIVTVFPNGTVDSLTQKQNMHQLVVTFQSEASVEAIFRPEGDRKYIES